MASNVPLVRPEAVDTLPFLDANTKIKYKNALINLYTSHKQSPAGSPQRAEFESKIRQASQAIMQAVNNASRPGGAAAAQQRPVSQQQVPSAASGQATQQGVAAQRPQTQGQDAGQNAGARPVQAAQPQQQQQQQPNQANVQQAGQQPQQQPQQQQQFTPSEMKIRAEIWAMTVYVPTGMPEVNHQKYIAAWRGNTFNVARQKERIAASATQISRQVQQLKAQGQPAPPQLTQQFEELRAQYTKLDNQYKTTLKDNQDRAPPGAQAANKPVAAGEAQRPVTQASNQAGQQQSQQNDVKPANLGQPQPTSLPAQQARPMMQNGQPAQNPQMAQAQQNMHQNTNTQQMPSQQQPQNATQPQLTQQNYTNNPNMTQQQQQAAMQQQQNGQQPQRPQVNVAQARQPSIQGQTPTSAMPGSAIQQNPQQHQQPQALTHQAAISQAQAHAAAANQQANGQQPHPNGLIYTGPNSGAAHTPHSQNTPTSAHPSGAAQGGNPYGPGQYPTAQQTTNTKFPIPKTLPMDPRTQQPVAGPPSRPTLSNAGAMNQPNIQRAPPYVLEGEGDHVLSKRKLDELVRQVTGSVGGGSAVSADGNKAEGAAGSLLDPDVEESILQVADDFVDAVIVSACRLAKLRPNQTLDIRDVQLVLERNYGIRIPGYALDEVRTVRKFVPSAGWQTKMQAVQAGKVMGNKEA